MHHVPAGTARRVLKTAQSHHYQLLPASWYQLSTQRPTKRTIPQTIPTRIFLLLYTTWNGEVVPPRIYHFPYMKGFVSLSIREDLAVHSSSRNSARIPIDLNASLTAMAIPSPSSSFSPTAIAYSHAPN